MTKDCPDCGEPMRVTPPDRRWQLPRLYKCQPCGTTWTLHDLIEYEDDLRANR